MTLIDARNLFARRASEASSAVATEVVPAKAAPETTSRGWYVISEREALDRLLVGLAEEWALPAKEVEFCRELRACLRRYRSFAMSPRQVIWLVDIVASTDGEFCWPEGETIREFIG